MASSRLLGRLPTGKHRTRRKGSTLWLVVGGLVFLSVLCGTIVYFAFSKNSSEDAPILMKVKRGLFTHDVIEEGEVESSNNVDVKCMAKSRNSGGTDILWAIEERTLVKKGDLLVKLDSSGWEQERDQQDINCNTSKAILEQAKNTLKAAEIALKEYIEGTFVQAKQEILSEIFVAEDNRRRAELSIRSTERLAAQGLLTSLQVEADRFAMKKANNELDLAKQKLLVLETLTKRKNEETFKSDINSAKAKMDAEVKSYELELKKLADIEQQIANCKIVAPQAGRVVHANKYSSRGGSAEFVVEEGSKVRQGQTIIRIPDPKQMQVKAKINESQITHVKVGMPVKINIDALGKEPLEGRVTKVSDFALPTNYWSQNIKQYVTEIQILNPPEKIRPGLTAEVRIRVKQLPDALLVPVQAIIEHDKKIYSLVKNGERYETRVVKIGSTNDKDVTILAGLKVDDQVVMNPRGHGNLLNLPKPTKADSQQQVSTVNRNTGSPPDTRVSQNDRGGRQGGASKEGGQRGRSGGSQSDPQTIVSRVFSQYDKDQDGKLTSSELESMSPDRRGRMSASDTNGDGVIDRAEMTTEIKKRFSGGRGQGPRGADQ